MRRSFLGLALLLALVAECGLAQPARYSQLSSIPAGEQIVLHATPADDSERSGFYVLDPASETLSHWRRLAGVSKPSAVLLRTRRPTGGSRR